MSMRRKFSRRDYILISAGTSLFLVVCASAGILLSGGQPRVSETYIPIEVTPVSPVIDVPEGLRGNPGVEASTQMMRLQIAQIEKTIESIKPLLTAHLKACVLEGAQEKSVGKERIKILQGLLQYRSKIGANAIQESVLSEACKGITTTIGAMGAVTAATGELHLPPIELNPRINEGIPRTDTSALATLVELLNNQFDELAAQNAVRQRAIKDASQVGGSVNADAD